MYYIMFSRSINTYRQLRVSHGSHMTAAHNVLYMKKHTNVRFISCDGHQLYDFKERGVDLEVEGVHYIEMHRGLHTYWARLFQGAESCVLVKIWRSTWNTYLIWRLNVVR